MAPIEFFNMPESPPCRTVEMVANIAGITLNKRYINLFAKDQYKEENLKVNPGHKVPFIIDGDLKLGESRAISAYIANRYMPADNTFYPKDPVARALVDELLYFDIGTLYQASSNLFRPYIFGDAKSLSKDAEQAFINALEKLNDRLKSNGNKKFLLGDELTLADVSIINTLALSRAGAFDISKFEKLTSYIERVESSIPKFNDVNATPHQNMKKFIADKIAQKS